MSDRTLRSLLRVAPFALHFIYDENPTEVSQSQSDRLGSSWIESDWVRSSQIESDRECGAGAGSTHTQTHTHAHTHRFSFELLSVGGIFSS